MIWLYEFSINKVNSKIVIRKGPYTVSFGDEIKDLKDLFNMDASLEMAHVLINDLMYGGHVPFNSPPPKMRCFVTAKERKLILEQVRKKRGK